MSREVRTGLITPSEWEGELNDLSLALAGVIGERKRDVVMGSLASLVAWAQLGVDREHRAQDLAAFVDTVTALVQLNEALRGPRDGETVQ